MTEIINSFDDYVTTHCQHKGTLSIETAKEYSNKGLEFLDKISNNETELGDRRNNMIYLQWYLIEESFKNGKPFGKGTFNLSLDNNELTKNLYEYFKDNQENRYKNKVLASVRDFLFGRFFTNNKVTHSRASSHYNSSLENPEDGHFGIDEDDNKVKLPWKFKNVCFGLCNDASNVGGEKHLSTYIKPETESADLMRKPIEAGIKHFWNLIKSKYLPSWLGGGAEVVEGLHGYRETAVSKTIVKEFNNLSDSKKKAPKNIYKMREALKNKSEDVVEKFNDIVSGNFNTPYQCGNELRFAKRDSGIELINKMPQDMANRGSYMRVK